MKRPVILICSEMIASIEERLQELNKYKNPSLPNFLYDYTLLEGVIRELNFQLYYAFPEKLNGKSGKESESIEIDKDILS